MRPKRAVCYRLGSRQCFTLGPIFGVTGAPLLATIKRLRFVKIGQVVTPQYQVTLSAVYLLLLPLKALDRVYNFFSLAGRPPKNIYFVKD